MKKIITSILFLMFPIVSYAAVTVGWNATSTDKGVIQPNAVNGNVPGINITSIIGASLSSCAGASNALTWINGQFGCNSISGGSGSPYPFTPIFNYAVLNQATTGIAWFQNGLNASSTSHFEYASTTAISSITSSSSNIFGGNLTSCNSVSNALTWDNGLFGCNSISGSGTNFFTSSSANTYLNTGSNLQAPSFEATSSTASIFPYASSTMITASSGIFGGDGGVYNYAMGSGVGTLGFNSFGYAAGVTGYGALMQLAPSTGQFSMFAESNVTAGSQHAHITTLSWDNTGLLTFPKGYLSQASSTVVGHFGATYASTTMISSDTASSTNLFGASLVPCTGTNLLQWSAGKFICTAESGLGTVTSITAGTGLLGGTITTSGTISGTLATSSIPTVGNLAYWTGNGTPSTLGTVATTSIGCSGNISCTGFVGLGSASTIAFTGTLPIANGGTNNTTFPNNSILYFDGTKIAATSSTLYSGNYVATSTTATSTFANGILVNGGTLGIASTTPGNASALGVTGHGMFSGTVYASNFYDTSFGGNSCIGESNGLLNTSNCVSSIASAGGSLTVSSPTGNVDVAISSVGLITNALTAWNGSKVIATGTPTLTVGNLVATTTLASQLPYASSTSATVTGVLYTKSYPALTYATSTAWTGTTTIPLGTAFIAEQWNAVQCFTDIGTLNVSFYDGTNRMDLLNASTTVGTFTLSTNNTFTAAEKRYVDIGTPATAPTKISCTVSRQPI